MSDVGAVWTVHITDDAIRCARREWRRALDALDGPRAELLYADLGRLVSAQAQQTADHFRHAATACSRADETAW